MNFSVDTSNNAVGMNSNEQHVSVQQFDPSLGTLLDIRFDAEGVSHISGDPGKFTGTSGSLDVDGTQILAISASTSDSTATSAQHSGSNSIDITIAPANAAFFIGSNTFNVDASVILLCQVGASCGASFSGDFTVTFDYTPGSSTAAVPGPVVGAGLPGLLVGFGAMLAWYRKRRAAV
jgi:hypothetical protein